MLHILLHTHTAHRTQVARTLRLDAHVPAVRQVRWHAQRSACQLRILPSCGEDTPARGAPAAVSPHHPRQTIPATLTWRLPCNTQLMETFHNKVSGHPHELRVTNLDGTPSTLPVARSRRRSRSCARRVSRPQTTHRPPSAPVPVLSSLAHRVPLARRAPLPHEPRHWQAHRRDQRHRRPAGRL